MKVRKVFTIIREYFLKVVHRKKVATQYILCEPDFVKQKHRLKTSSFLKKKKIHAVENDHNYLCN